MRRPAGRDGTIVNSGRPAVLDGMTDNSGRRIVIDFPNTCPRRENGRAFDVTSAVISNEIIIDHGSTS